MEIKSVISLKDGKSYSKPIDNTNLLGKKVSEKIDGALIGFKGLELEITGGSDNAGFPMRADIPSHTRKKILTSNKSVGINIESKGVKVRKTVRGGIIAEDIAQVNLKVIKGNTDQYFKEEPKTEAPVAS
ncbi:MAG: S6e family ribosomal protein [Candidatus Nanoarchaeia archaeon]|nr:S6e family ribosomal protein [Candidatus Nanoarchaeia archaeon]